MKLKHRTIALFLAAALLIAAQAVFFGVPRAGMPLSMFDLGRPAINWVELDGGFKPGGVGTGGGTGSSSARFPHSNFKSWINQYAATNTDVKGWLHVPNTNISVPVPLNTSNDNTYYLYREWKGTNHPGLNWKNWAGYPDTASYLDYRTKLGGSWNNSSTNMVIYGHNWNNLRAPFAIGNHKNMRMFAQLKSYTNVEFAKQNPHIYFSTSDMEGIWRVFAVGYAVTTPSFFYNGPNPGSELRQTLVSEWRQISHLAFDVDVNADDRLLTLTTCTRQYGSSDRQRFVVVARLLRPGESENDVVNVTQKANQNIKHPNFSLPAA